MKQRCEWVTQDQIYLDYHDKEWGKPQFESYKLFEQLCLEGQQAGLSWLTILKKRAHYRQVFYAFDPYKIAQIQPAYIDQLMQDPGLIRHRAKLEAIVKNAQAYVAMEKCGENFSEFIWSFVQGEPQINNIPSIKDIPVKTETSKVMSKALKKRGFVFVGETICYAFMQSMGLVEDHTNQCHCKKP